LSSKRWTLGVFVPGENVWGMNVWGLTVGVEYSIPLPKELRLDYVYIRLHISSGILTVLDPEG